MAKEQLGKGPVEGNTIPGNLEVGGALTVGEAAGTVTGEWPAGSPGKSLCSALAAAGLIVDETTEAEE